jgi:hypothetical protein
LVSKVSEELFKEWKKQVITGIPQARDCFYGMAIGARFGDREGEVKPTVLTPANQWFNNSMAARTCTPDFRRLEKNRYKDSFLEKYIASLRFGSPGNVNYDVYKTWLSDLGWKDWNFICIILNDTTYGATNWGAFFVSMGDDIIVPVFKPGTHPLRIDHKPAFTLANLTDGKINPISLAQTMAHEFAHSMNLGDEYEGYDDPAHSQFTNNTANITFINDSNNLTHIFELQSATAPPKIQGDKIKWNWHRIKQVSKTIAPAVDDGANQVKILVKSGEGAKWKPIKDANLQVFLRAPGMNNTAADRTKGLEGPFTLSMITHSAGSDEIFLKPRTRSVAGNYDKGSILFLPVTDIDDKMVMTIEKPVLDFINTTGKGFDEATDCTNCRDDVAFPPTTIPNFTYPAHHYEVIGLYEGGGTFNCKVFRPAGVCIMRAGEFKLPAEAKSRLATFSFVAKYIIVNHIDPLQLPKLNPLYPS